MDSQSEYPSLDGHKLLILSPNHISPASIDAIKAKHPGLKVLAHQQPFESKDPYENVTEEEWEDVTIAMVGSALPPVSAAPKLQLVQLCNAGVNHVSQQPFLRETNVPFCTAGGVAGPQIAEWVMSTYLAFQHHLPLYLKFQQDEHWEKLPDAQHDDAIGQAVGILGYGSIGRQIARVSKAIGMTVHAYTHRPRGTPSSRVDTSFVPPGLGDPDGSLPDKWFSGSLDAFLSSSLDLLVIAVPLTPKTKNLIGKAEFALLATRRTFVCNVARGAVVRTGDLVEALEKGTIRGAALDVTEPEPLPPGHALWKARNVIITPHCAGTTSRYAERLVKVMELNLERLGRGERLANEVDKVEGY